MGVQAPLPELDEIEPDHRAAARALAIPDSFDSRLAIVLAGPRAGEFVLALARRGVLSPTDKSGARHQFAPALRDALRAELRHVAPEEYRSLLVDSARHYTEIGDLTAAYRALASAGEPGAEFPVVVKPLLELASAGEAPDLDRALAALPPSSTVDEPLVAVAVAEACLLTGRLTIAAQWLARCWEFVSADPAFERRRDVATAQRSLLSGDLDAAGRHLEAAGGHDAAGPIHADMTATGLAARLALIERRPDTARGLIKQLEPDRLAEREALTAWSEVLDGNIVDAARRLAPLLDDVEQLAERPDQALLDAVITGAWTSYFGGDLATANRYATLALTGADGLSSDWTLLRAGAVAVTTLLRISGPSAARGLLVETRLRRRGVTSVLDVDLDLAEAAIFRQLGRPEEASSALARLGDTPPTRVVRASMQVAEHGAVITPGLLDGFESWLAPDRIPAAILAGLGELDTMSAAVAEAGRLGLVMPLVGHGATVDGELARLPLERLHPRLGQYLGVPLAPIRPLASTTGANLTPRERTVLALLPSHLTYEQIAVRLSLSVNTIKSNVKSIYRKLSVSSRSDAVDAARAARLV